MSRRNMYGNKETVHHTILFWVFLIICVLGMFGILVFFSCVGEGFEYS